MQEAIVEVDGWKAKRHALGRGNQNVKLAMELTGWNIEVKDTSIQ